MKKLFIIIRKICLSIFLIYGLNVLITSLNIFIPINLFTIGIVAILGVPGILSLIALFFFI